MVTQSVGTKDKNLGFMTLNSVFVSLSCWLQNRCQASIIKVNHKVNSYLCLIKSNKAFY